MRVGRYTGAGFLIVLLLLSAYVHANPLAVAAVRVLPRLFSSVVAKRAANDAVYLSTVKAVNNVAAKEIVKNAGRSSLFKDAVGAASWVLLGFNVVDAFSLNDDSVIMQNVDNGRLTNYITSSFERNKYNENPFACLLEENCEISALTNIRFKKKIVPLSLVRGIILFITNPRKKPKIALTKYPLTFQILTPFINILISIRHFQILKAM